MFCPSCGRQNQENEMFCAFCGKALPQKNSQLPSAQYSAKANTSQKSASAPRFRLSFTAVKAIVTVLLLVGIILVVLQLYYPGVFPWNN
jgi:uncharacterized membrane protein YvbJ